MQLSGVSKTVVIWLVCFVSIAFGGCSNTPQLASLSSDAAILAFGDSLTSGYGATPETSYPAVLSQLSGKRIVNAGIPGETTAAALARLPQVLDRERPALVLLCLGGNDFLQRLDQKQAEENLRAMVRMMRERGIGVVLIGVPRLGWGLEVPDWYASIAHDAGIPYEGTVLQRVLGERSLKSDTIHPNAAGYRQMAEALHKLLKKSGALP